MSAVPRWSHRDPVEGGNPFPAGDPRCTRWDAATARARAALQRYDADLEVVANEQDIYARRWLDLATMRFDTWAGRGLAAVNGTAAERDYAAWLQAYLANWRAYVAETCPHVRVEMRDRLAAHLAAHAAYWTNEARRLVSSARGAPAAAARPGPPP